MPLKSWGLGSRVLGVGAPSIWAPQIQDLVRDDWGLLGRIKADWGLSGIISLGGCILGCPMVVL